VRWARRGIALDEGDGVGIAPMLDNLDWVGVGVVVAALSLVVSIVSTVIAAAAKRETKKAATLGPKIETINHLRDAVAALKNDRSFTPSAVQSIRDAKRAAIMFNDKVRSELDDAVQTADRLISQQGRTSKLDPPAINALVGDLQSLIERMNAALR
jgi:hypothetical protein